MDAEKLIERGRDERYDLQLELYVVGRGPVVARLRIHDVESQTCEVARDGRGVALSPAGVVEKRIMDPVQPQRESDQHDGQQPELPKPLPQLR